MIDLIINSLVLSVALFCVFYSIASSLVTSTQAKAAANRHEFGEFQERERSVSLNFSKSQKHPSQPDTPQVKSCSTTTSADQYFLTLGRIKQHALQRRHSEPWCHTIQAKRVTSQVFIPDSQKSVSFKSCHDYVTYSGRYCSQAEMKEEARRGDTTCTRAAIEAEAVQDARKESVSEKPLPTDVCSKEDGEEEPMVSYDSQSDGDESEEWGDQSTDILADSEHLVEKPGLLSLRGRGRLCSAFSFKELSQFCFPMKFITIKTNATNTPLAPVYTSTLTSRRNSKKT